MKILLSFFYLVIFSKALAAKLRVADPSVKTSIPLWHVCSHAPHSCISGAVCGGGPPKRCVHPIGEGRSCTDSYHVCGTGLQCVHGLCRRVIAANGLCGAPGTQCAPDLACAGGPPKKCITLVNEGGRCGLNPYWICASGLTCVSNYCRKATTTFGLCGHPGSSCPHGSICGGGPPKRCVPPVPVNGKCGTDPFQICGVGLRCESNVCKTILIAQNGDCSAPTSTCAPGLTCAGGPPKRCIKLMPAGQRCQTDPWWICEDGLSCISNICQRVLPQLANCEVPGTICAAGLTCAGGPPRKCIKFMMEGQRCGVDPYWLCAAGLTCISHVCRKRVLPQGAHCGTPGTTCATGLICGGGPPRRCIKLMEEGGRCGVDPWWICKPGLRCLSNICRSAVIPRGHLCGTPGTSCEAGFICGGGPPRRCIKLMAEGQRCGVDPWWLCQEGLECVSHICRKRFIPRGGICGAPNTICATGLTCAGGPPRKCISLMAVNQRCGTDPWWICQPGLTCLSNICKRIIPKGHICDAVTTGSACATGLICAGGPPKRCITFMSEGQQCGIDPWWICKSGLRCIGNVCRIPVIPIWGVCDAPGSLCAPGLVCGGGPPKRCVRGIPAGHSCGLTHYSVCASGLHCVLHVCRSSSH